MKNHSFLVRDGARCFSGPTVTHFRSQTGDSTCGLTRQEMTSRGDGWTTEVGGVSCELCYKVTTCCCGDST